ncbi:MAG TPA: class I SAM-dependent methyltransferase [Rhodopila sp.]|nr:class I SAM-dependent methyltransferase [Rhodopila sp.]
MDRAHLLRGPVGPASRIVEIGAGYNPIAPKRDGWNTHVVDHATQEALRTKYATANVDPALIEDVDTVWLSGPLHEAVPDSLVGRVDAIIASHVLEHLPDLVGFLQSAARLLTPGGYLSIALPDRRYCFDCLKPWTSTGDLLDAHRRGLQRHTIKTAYNHFAYAATVDGALAWGARPVDTPQLADPFWRAEATASQYDDSENAPYQDFHAWQFTLAGFELAILELNALGLSPWWVEEISGPVGFEFFARLRHTGGVPRSPDELQDRRRDLLLKQVMEVKEQAEFLLQRSGAAQHPLTTGAPEPGHSVTPAVKRSWTADLRQLLRPIRQRPTP